jgi:transposase InsO family protein/transposase-like protein
MYSYEERLKAVRLFVQYNLSVAPVIRELGYPSRQMLYLWYKDFKENGNLLRYNDNNRSKYSNEQRKQAIWYYLEHGRNISKTIKALGYPKRTTLRDWLNEDLPTREKHCFIGRALVKCTNEQKEQAVIRLCAKDGTAKTIANDFGVTTASLYTWRKQLLNERWDTTVPNKLKPPSAKVKSDSSKSEALLTDEKQSLAKQVEELKVEVHRLQMERDILEKAGELLKKDQGINLESLTNREKVTLIDALRDRYRLKMLLEILHIAKSSYCYQRRVLRGPDKYAELRLRVTDIFTGAHRCYGYRRIHAVVRRDGVSVSEKVIRKIMKEECLRVPHVKKKKYNSYMGEISPEVENIINRDFNADQPNSKWLTDITEFSISAGKVYLSPIIDCFDGMAVSWTIGTSPNGELVNTMLDAAISLLGEKEHPIIHSDRGGHYRWPGWIERVQDAELTRSMSKKGCSPDNSACEGFFGQVKNEMFYGRSWLGVSVAEFTHTLDSYLRWHNETRIKMSLGAKSPLEYRQSLGLAEYSDRGVST